MQYRSIIYKVTNKINGKIYIGQSHMTLEERFNDDFLGHFTKAFNTNKNNYFYNALRKYGKDNFTYEIIEESKPRTSKKCKAPSTKQWLNEREKYWVAYYHSNDHSRGYNQTSGGQKDYVRTESEIERLAYQSKLNMARPGIREQISQKIKKLWENPDYRNRVISGLKKKALTNPESFRKGVISRVEKTGFYNDQRERAGIRFKRRRGIKEHRYTSIKRIIKKIPRKMINLIHYFFILKYGPDYRLRGFNESQKGKAKKILRKLTLEQEAERRRKISENSRWKIKRTPEESRIRRNERKRERRIQRRLDENKV